jgi:lipopolysaccharide exporter
MQPTDPSLQEPVPAGEAAAAASPTGKLKARLGGFMEGSSFVKHVMVVSGSVAIGQALSILVGPINSRLYKPEDYGTLSLFGGMFSVLSLAATFQYEMAIGTAEDDDEAIHLVLLSILLALGWGLALGAASFLAGPAVAGFFAKGDAQVLRYLWFLPVGVFSAAISSTFQRWAMRKQAFPRLSMIQVVQGFLVSACTVSFGFLHFGFKGLMIGSLAGSCYMALQLPRLFYPDLGAHWGRLAWAKLVEVAKRHYRYPLYTTWSSLLSCLSNWIPVFLMTQGFGTAATGYFSMCQRILFLPTILISQAITPVFYSRAKKAQLDGTLATLTERMVNTISGVNVFFAVFMALFGEQLFSLVFGAKWGRSGLYAAALAPWMLFSFLVNPLEALPLVFNRQRTSFIFQIVLFGVRAGSMALGIYLKSDLAAMWLYGGGSALYMLGYFIWMLRLVDGPVGSVLRKLGWDLALSLMVFGACKVVFWLTGGNLWITGACLAPSLGFFAYRAFRQIMQGRNLG